MILPPTEPRRNQELLNAVTDAVTVPVPVPEPPPFKFEVSEEAAQFNNAALSAFGYNLGACISHKQTTCTPGSEFRPIETLDRMFRLHPLWQQTKQMLTSGATMHLHHAPDDAQRIKENAALAALRNHKKARDHPEVIMKSLLAEVEMGFCCVLPISALEAIPHAMLCPLGIVEQFSLSATGERKLKRRLTHDQTFSVLDNSESVNDLNDQAAYHELLYGCCLQRIIFHALAIRYHYPLRRILCCKYDFAKAYRRLHYDGLSAVRCIAIFGHWLYLMLRLSFGGAGCPPSWCMMSELITELANELMQNPDWTGFMPLRSPDQHLVPTTVVLSDDVPFQPTLPTMLLPPPRPEGASDVFVDDVITVFLDTEENRHRAPAAVPLAIHAVARPLHAHEPLPRENMLSLDKLDAEGGPSEVKCILGWIINFRELTIALPTEKFVAWSADIASITHHKRCTKMELEQLIGRLTHAAHIIPLARFFLGRIRAKSQKPKYSRSIVRFNNSDLKLLSVWPQFLARAHGGISLNLLSVRIPTNIVITDACPAGLGGFSVTSGKAWRIPLPENHTTVNNSLEFLASAVGILIEHRNQHIPHLGNVLALTDNSSCVSWLHKSNFDWTNQATNAEISTYLATYCINNAFTIHSQHIKGNDNKLADALSRQNDLTDTELTSFAYSHFPTQTPKNLRICPTPPDILSWVYSTVALSPSCSTAKQNRPTKNQIDAGVAGPHSWHRIPSATTPSWMASQHQQKFPCAARSSNHYVRDTSLGDDNEVRLEAKIRANYLAGVCGKPLASWLRSSGAISDQAPFMSTTNPTSWSEKSTTYSEHGNTKTQVPTATLPSHRSTCDSFMSSLADQDPPC